MAWTFESLTDRHYAEPVMKHLNTWRWPPPSFGRLGVEETARRAGVTVEYKNGRGQAFGLASQPAA